MPLLRGVESGAFGVLGYLGLLFRVESSLADVDKLKRDASWSPETSFIDGIRKTAQSFVTGAFPIS